MEFLVLLIPPLNHFRVASWNANGVKTKLKKGCVSSVFLSFDIINLHEIKTPLPVSFPG